MERGVREGVAGLGRAWRKGRRDEGLCEAETQMAWSVYLAVGVAAVAEHVGRVQVSAVRHLRHTQTHKASMHACIMLYVAIRAPVLDATATTSETMLSLSICRYEYGTVSHLEEDGAVETVVVHTHAHLRK
jgi:hypothetical protein